MKRHRISWIALIWLVGTGMGFAQTKTVMEPVVAAIEPVALRTALARPMTDAKYTVITPAKEDSVLGVTQYTKEEFAAAGLDWDQFMAKAAAAATRLLVTIKPIVAKDAAGQVAYVKLQSERPFTASVVFSPRLVPLFQGVLGDRLVALMPDRFTVYLFSRNFGQFQSFGQKILNDHAEAIYPASIEVFEISRDGVKCIGGFDDGADAPVTDPAAASKVKPELPPKEGTVKPVPRVEVPLRSESKPAEVVPPPVKKP